MYRKRHVIMKTMHYHSPNLTNRIRFGTVFKVYFYTHTVRARAFFESATDPVVAVAAVVRGGPVLLLPGALHLHHSHDGARESFALESTPRVCS